MLAAWVPVDTPLADEDMSVSADVTRDEWEAYVESRPEASVYHAWDWRHVFESVYGHRTEYLAARRGRAIVGVLPLVAFDHALFGRFMVSLPFVNYGGVLADDQPARDGLLAEARRRAAAYGMTHVELRHVQPQFPTLARRTHKVSMTLDLAGDVDTAWSTLDRKLRNHIRKAEKYGLTTDAGGAELLPDFYGVFARNMRDLGTPVYPSSWFGDILARFAPRARVTVVRMADRPIAAAFTIGYRSSIEVPSAGSLREFRYTSANTLLYWHLMKQAIEGGYRTFDFGRSSPGDGPFTFKKQWGATPGPLTWEYVLHGGRAVPDRSRKNARFSLAISAWQRMPLAVANRVGPSIVRYLP